MYIAQTAVHLAATNLCIAIQEVFMIRTLVASFASWPFLLQSMSGLQKTHTDGFLLSSFNLINLFSELPARPLHGLKGATMNMSAKEHKETMTFEIESALRTH